LRSSCCLAGLSSNSLVARSKKLVLRTNLQPQCWR
jgi:hypothetical protein